MAFWVTATRWRFVARLPFWVKIPTGQRYRYTSLSLRRHAHGPWLNV